MKNLPACAWIAEYARRLTEAVRKPGFIREIGARMTAVWVLVTRIPLPWLSLQTMRPLGADAMTMMPIVGGLFGLVCAIPARLVAFAVPLGASAWIGCGLYTILGWSLHLDGWGDLWDGIGSGKRGEAMRNIMKDSRVGTFGVAGVTLAIAIRASLLSSIDADNWITVCAVAGGIGRFTATVTARFGKYPWENGMGRDVVHGFDGFLLLCSFAAVCILFPLAPLVWIAGIIPAGLAGAALAVWANKNLGGSNGDVLGASSVLGELLVLAVCSVNGVI